MDAKISVLALTFMTLLKCGEAQYYYSSVYTKWWFWLVAVVVFLLKLGCVCYIVQRKRRRDQMYGQAAMNGMNMTQQVSFPQPASTGSVPPAAMNGMNMTQQVSFPQPAPTGSAPPPPPYIPSGGVQIPPKRSQTGSYVQVPPYIPPGGVQIPPSGVQTGIQAPYPQQLYQYPQQQPYQVDSRFNKETETPVV